MKLFLILLFTPLISFAATQDILEGLGAKCEQGEAVTCVLDSGSFDYPNKSIFVFNKDSLASDILFHLHGYAFGKFTNGEDFDSTPKNLVESFKFSTAIKDSLNTVLVIPFTTGKCKDYDSYLASKNNFENYMIQITEKLNPSATLHLSAHSGGGRTLAKTINRMSLVIKSVSLFDANYSSSRRGQYSSWTKINNKILNLIAVAPKAATLDFSSITGSTPFNETKIIYSNFSGEQTYSGKVPENSPRFYFFQKRSETSRINFWYENKIGKYHHWYIVRDTFPTILKEIIK